jgi:RHS repeat-associated protein
MLTDHLGSVVAVTNSAGTLESEQRYLPFGQVRADVGSIAQTDYGYTGQRALDSDMGGIMDYRARFYSPMLGRFLQPDSIIPNPASPQNFNRYSYVGNNPINHTDPSGYCEDETEYFCRHSDDQLGNGGGTGGSGKDIGDYCTRNCDFTFTPSTTPPPTANDRIYQTFVSPLADAICGNLFGSGNCTNGIPNVTVPKIAGSPSPSLVDRYCNNASVIACLGIIAQDIAVGIDVVGVATIELPAVGVGCAVGGPLGCVAGESAAWMIWNVTLNPVESVFSGASFVFTWADDVQNNGGPGENTFTSGVTLLAGQVPLNPSYDLAVDVYGSAYNHGYVNGITDIVSGGSLFR